MPQSFSASRNGASGAAAFRLVLKNLKHTRYNHTFSFFSLSLSHAHAQRPHPDAMFNTEMSRLGSCETRLGARMHRNFSARFAHMQMLHDFCNSQLRWVVRKHAAVHKTLVHLQCTRLVSAAATRAGGARIIPGST
jgi:hypothetical protein